jgi:hypothetical protein
MGWKIIVLSIFRRPGVAFRRALRHSSRVHRTKHTSVVCGLLARIVYHAGGPSFPHHRSPPEHPATRRRRNLVGPVVPSDGDRRRPGGRAAPCRALLSGFGGWHPTSRHVRRQARTGEKRVLSCGVAGALRPHLYVCSSTLSIRIAHRSYDRYRNLVFGMGSTMRSIFPTR